MKQLVGTPKITLRTRFIGTFVFFMLIPMVMAMLLSFYLLRVRMGGLLEEKVAFAVDAAERAIGEAQQESLGFLQEIAYYPEIALNIAAGEYAKLREVLSVKFAESGRDDRLFILDKTGWVIARAEDPKRFGDVLSGNPVIAEALRGNVIKTIQEVEGGLFLSVLLPLKRGNNVQLVLVLNKRIDRSFAEHIRDISGSDITFLKGEELIATTVTDASGRRPKEIPQLSTSAWVASPDELHTVPFIFNVGAIRMHSRIKPLSDFDGKTIGLTVSSLPMTQALAVEPRTRNHLIAAGIVFVLLAGMAGFFLARTITRPMLALSRGAEAVSQGKLGYQVDIKSQGEIAELVESFNKMSGQLKASTDELTSAKTYTENVIKSMSEALIVVTADGRLRTVNEACRKLLGYEERELVGKSVTMILSGATEDESGDDANPFIGSGFEELLNKGILSNCDMVYRAKSGEEIPVNFSGSAMKDTDGNVTEIVGIARDMREVNTLRTKVVEAEKMTVLGKLSGAVSHELRNPLNAMKSSLYYIRSKLTDADEKVQKHLDILDRSISSSDKIIGDILGFARVREPVLEDAQINQLVRSAISDIRIPKGVKVEFEFGEDLPDIPADTKQLAQVFTNIATNAVQAMQDHGILHVKTSLNGSRMDVAVTDDGPGIEAEALAKVFEPMYSTKAQGTGLGLAVCRSLVHGHGGSITAKSRKGYGTTFTVSLPLKKLT